MENLVIILKCLKQFPSSIYMYSSYFISLTSNCCRVSISLDSTYPCSVSKTLSLPIILNDTTLILISSLIFLQYGYQIQEYASCFGDLQEILFPY